MALTSKNFFTNKDSMLPDDLLIKIRNLVVDFKIKGAMLHAVRGVSLSVRKGQIVGIVGESGSGKSVCVKSLLGFNSGGIINGDLLNLCDIDIKKLNKKTWPFVRGTYVSYIPQDPLMSLNPTKKIGAQIRETILISEKRRYKSKKIELKKEYSTNKKVLDEKLSELKTIYKEKIKKENVEKELINILEFIGIENVKQRLRYYPHQFSGGMRQRIVIAMALAMKPRLIIADEPTTALDVTVQAKVLELIKRLRDVYNITIVFISHNMALVANFCDYIYVMYAGKIVEQGLKKEIFLEPKHPYTWALISSIPEGISGELPSSIPGSPPNLTMAIRGDAFAPRNKYAMKIDFEKEPPFFNITEFHKAATWLLHENAPHVDLPKDVKDKINIMKKSFDLLDSSDSNNNLSITDNIYDTKDMFVNKNNGSE